MREEPLTSEANGLCLKQEQPAQATTRATHQQQVLKKQSSIQQRIFEACKLKDLTSIRLLLKEHPELVNQREKQDRSLLHYAVIQTDERQDSENAIKCFNFLQEQADQRLWLHQDRDGLSLLHLAVISANDVLVEHLAERHPLALRLPLVNSLDRERHSPLHWAVITNNLTSVKVLIRAAGTELAHEPDLNGATPLHYATQSGDFPRYRRQLRRLLAGGESMNVTGGAGNGGGGGEEMSSGEIEGRSSEILKFLLDLNGIHLECKDRDQRTPLLWAASSGNWIALDLLLEHGANPLSYDLNRLSALHCAASRGHLRCLESLLNGPYSEAESPKKRLDPDQKDNMNCTALFYAVLGSNVDCIEILLERGADPNWQDSKGRTASHFAALRGQLNALKLLRERGANLWLANKLGDLPLHYAVKSGRLQVVRWLLEGSPYEQAVNAINNLGRAPIHLAVQRNDPALLTYLLENSPNLAQLAKVRTGGVNLTVDHQSTKFHQKYETALDAAERLNRSECSKILLNVQAPRAAQVLSERAQLGRALFKTLDTESPIGFETSCSEAVDQTNSRPCSDDLTQAESNSPAVNNLAPSCSPSSCYDAIQSPSKQLDLEQPLRANVSSNVNAHAANNGRINLATTNELAGTSIKSKTRPTTKQSTVSHRSRISTSAGQEFVTNVNVYTSPCPRCAHNKSWQPVPILGCSCAATTLPALTYDVGSSEATTTCAEEDDEEEEIRAAPYDELYTQDRYSSGQNAHEASSDNEDAQSTHLPDLLTQQQQLTSDESVVKNLPPVIGYNSAAFNKIQQQRRSNPTSEPTSRLPVILSEREQSSNSSSSVNEPYQLSQTDGCIGKVELDDVEDSDQKQHSSRNMSSPAQEVPRFDRFSRDTTRLSSIRRSRAARSPVAEYINSSPINSGQTVDDIGLSLKKSKYQQSSYRKSHQQHPYHQQQYSTTGTCRASTQTVPQTNRLTNQLATCRTGQDRLRSKSQTRSSDVKASPRGVRDQQARSLSRQTIIKTRRLSVDSVELASRVEKAIRKYKQETKLFEELQNLKRSQIRSGRANEALLVKRLVENLRANTSHLLGLDSYSGPYTYKAYERFLYDQLRKLSLSNRAKLSPTKLLPTAATQQLSKVQSQAGRYDLPYEEVSSAELERLNAEDASAEQELRRIIAGKSGRDSSLDLAVNDSSDLLEREESEDSLFVLEPTGALEDLRVKGKSGENIDRELVHTSGGEKKLQAKESSTVESESDSRKFQETLSGYDEKVACLVEEAKQLSSAILVDALGNISRIGSPKQSRSNSSEGFRLLKNSASNEKIDLSSHKHEFELDEVKESENRKDDLVLFNELEIGDSGFNNKVDFKDSNARERDKEENLLKHKSGEEDEINKEEKERLDEQIVPKSGRRRSVINIGDKIDIIYHDVGIEIEKVPDRKLSLEENEQEVNSLLQQNDLISKGKLEGVKELEEEEKKPSDGVRKQAKDGKGERISVKDEKRFDHIKIMKTPKSDDMLPMSQSKTVIARRASSPPVCAVQDAAESRRRRDVLKRSTSVSRGNIIGYGDQIATKDSIENSTELENLGISEMMKISETTKEVEVEAEREESTPDIGMRRGDNLSPSTLKRRKERSQVPAGKYKPQVPLKEIKLRWDEIKAHEKSILKEATGGDLTNGENYTLLYEINKGTLVGMRAGNEIVASDKRTRWCHRRIARIVDVRTVKRTLSLPESLIYSNDLLKRFDILKL